MSAKQPLVVEHPNPDLSWLGKLREDILDPDLPIKAHVGGPLGFGPNSGKRDEVIARWHDAMRQLAACPNVHVKLGGLAMAINGFDFHRQVLPPSSGELAQAWQPWMHACIDAFGANRCMSGISFPVDQAMCSYPALWNAFKRIAAGAHFYRIDI